MKVERTVNGIVGLRTNVIYCFNCEVYLFLAIFVTRTCHILYDAATDEYI